MRLLSLVAVMVTCLAALLGVVRSVGARLDRGARTGCTVHFQRFALSRHSVYYRVTHHDLTNDVRLKSKPVPAIERRYQTISPDKRYITAARIESIATYYGDYTFRLVVRPYGVEEEIVLAEYIRVHNPLHMQPALWTAWTADSRLLHYAWQTPLGESFLAAYDVQRRRVLWKIQTDGRATYRLLRLREELVSIDRVVRAVTQTSMYHLPCAPVILHPNES